jgi:hypothetical protein
MLLCVVLVPNRARWFDPRIRLLRDTQQRNETTTSPEREEGGEEIR